jgi:hypothetical protein
MTGIERCCRIPFFASAEPTADRHANGMSSTVFTVALLAVRPTAPQRIVRPLVESILMPDRAAPPAATVRGAHCLHRGLNLRRIAVRAAFAMQRLLLHTATYSKRDAKRSRRMTEPRAAGRGVSGTHRKHGAGSSQLIVGWRRAAPTPVARLGRACQRELLAQTWTERRFVLGSMSAQE